MILSCRVWLLLHEMGHGGHYDDRIQHFIGLDLFGIWMCRCSYFVKISVLKIGFPHLSSSPIPSDPAGLKSWILRY
ncbi:hypothetical protein Lal_00016373 [Lupinus albus]|nr:hypothetical protein Lal_00016373 [Lupinus albus]